MANIASSEALLIARGLDMRILVISAAMLYGCTVGAWTDFYGDPRSASIPPDVRKFVTNAQACRHFSGEDPYDAERAAFLAKRIKKTCNGLPEMRERLLKRHQGHNEALNVISETWQNVNE